MPLDASDEVQLLGAMSDDKPLRVYAQGCIYQDKFSGILNGIDYDFWHPERDRYIPQPFKKPN